MVRDRGRNYVYCGNQEKPKCVGVKGTVLEL